MTFVQMAPTNSPDTFPKKKTKYNYRVPSPKNGSVLNFGSPNFAAVAGELQFGKQQPLPPLLPNGESPRKQRASSSTTNGAYAGAKFNDPPPPKSLPPPPDRWLEDLVVKVTPVEKSCENLTSQLKTLLNIEEN